MIRRKSFKSWEQTRNEIEKVLDSYTDATENDLTLANGIQHKCTISHNSSPIFSVAYRPSNKSHVEFYILNYISPDSGESFFVQWKYDSISGICKLTKKVVIRQCLKLLIYIPNQHAFIGYCSDMTLRGYSGVSFEEKSRLAVHSSILCMLYIDEFDELVTAGQGYVFSWHVKIIEYGFLVDPKNPPFITEVNSGREWVTRLFYDKLSKTIMALTDDIVYVISIITRQQIGVFYNSHKSSLTYCSFYQPLQYFITAARDGTVHIYHTGLQNHIRSFSAHLDGITGVACLDRQPILITWSQKCGTMRMWRLDTMEMTNETTLSQSINRLFLPKEDRLFYLGETEVQIFSINILYGIFTNMSSAIDTMKLCNIRRISKSVQSDASFKHRHSGDFAAVNSTNLLDTNANEKETKKSKRWSQIINKLEVGANPEEYFVKSMQDENLGVDKSSYLDERLVCVLDDHSIVEVSPLTGQIINITYPTSEIDQKHLSIDIERKGQSCFVALQTGTFVHLDISSNPGKIAMVREPRRDEQKILSVVTVELYVDEGMYKGLRTQATLHGLENGSIALSDDNIDSNSIRNSRKTSEFRDLKLAHSNKDKVDTAVRRISSGTDAAEACCSTEPVLIMSPIQAHHGQVLFMLAPADGSVTIDHDNDLRAKIYNILLTFGADEKAVVWRASIVPGSKPNRFEILLNKLQHLALNQCPTCSAVTSNILLLGFGNGQIEMYGFNWKYYVSGTGAIIKIECNIIVLPGFRKIVVDKEFHHKQKVTSAHASQILNLFVTTAEDALIKIWDTDGMLVRELILGDIIPAACFASGRNLLAALKSHIILIEAPTYLPTEYLQKLLKYADDTEMTDPEPETPLPLTGAEDSVMSVEKMKSISKEISKIERYKSEEISSKADLENMHDSMKNINHLLRYLRRKRSFYSQALEAVQKQENVVEVFSGIRLKEYMPIIRIEDLAENFLTEEQKERMKKIVMAPDGEIPNSVVRIYFKPVIAVEVIRQVQQTTTSRESRSFFVELNKERKFRRRLTSYDEVYYVESDESSFGEIEERRSSLNRNQILELSERSKWEMKDELMEKRIVRRFGSKIHVKSKKHAVVEEIKSIRNEKQTLAGAASQQEVDARSMRLNKLMELLKDLQKQRWCSHILTLDTFAEGLSAISDIMNRAGTKIGLEICKSLLPVIQACQQILPEDEYHDLFSASLQRKFAPRLGELLFSPLNSLQRAAANFLSQFSDDVLLSVISHNLMPKFIQSSGDTKILQSNELILAEASRVVKYLSFHIDTGRLYSLARLAKVDEYRKELTDEQSAVLEGIGEALNRDGVDPIDLLVWANFALPLLAKRESSILTVFHPPPLAPSPIPIDLEQEQKPTEEPITEKEAEKSDEVDSATASNKRKFVSSKSRGGKTKAGKVVASTATKKASLLEAIQQDLEKNRRVSFVEDPKTIPSHLAAATTIAQQAQKKEIKSILTEKSRTAEKDAAELKEKLKKKQAKPAKQQSKSITKDKAGTEKKVLDGVEATADELKESADLSRVSSADILRRSSRDLKQYPELWVEEERTPVQSEASLEIGGMVMGRNASNVEIPLKTSFEILHPGGKRSRRYTLGSDRDLHTNEQIYILQSKRRLSLQRTSSIQAGKKISAHFTGISRDSTLRSSIKDQSKISHLLSPEDALLRLQPEERLAEDEYESFLPAIVERSGEFETLANENIVPDFEQVPSRKSSSGEKIGAGIPAVNLEAASDVRVENQEVDIRSSDGDSSLSFVYPQSFLPTPPPPTISLCDDMDINQISSTHSLDELTKSTSYTAERRLTAPLLGEFRSLSDHRVISIDMPFVSYDPSTETDTVDYTISGFQAQAKLQTKSLKSHPKSSKAALGQSNSGLALQSKESRPVSSKSWPGSSKPPKSLAKFRPKPLKPQRPDLLKAVEKSFKSRRPESVVKSALLKPELKKRRSQSPSKEQSILSLPVSSESWPEITKVRPKPMKYQPESLKNDFINVKTAKNQQNSLQSDFMKIQPQPPKRRPESSKPVIFYLDSTKIRSKSAEPQIKLLKSDLIKVQAQKAEPSEFVKPRSEVARYRSQALESDLTSLRSELTKPELSKDKRAEVRSKVTNSRPKSLETDLVKPRFEPSVKKYIEPRLESVKVRPGLAKYRTEPLKAKPPKSRPEPLVEEEIESRPESAKSCPESSVIHPQSVVSRLQSLLKPEMLSSTHASSKHRLDVYKEQPRHSRSTPESTRLRPELLKTQTEILTSRLKQAKSLPVRIKSKDNKAQLKLIASHAEPPAFSRATSSQMKSADNVDNYALETPADTVYLKNTHVLELSTELDRATSKAIKPPSPRDRPSSFFHELRRFKKVAVEMTKNVEDPETWREVLQALRSIRLLKQERRKIVEQYQQATNYTCPPSPVCSPAHDLRNRGDFVAAPFNRNMVHNLASVELEEKIKRRFLIANLPKTKSEKSKLVAGQERIKIRKILNKVIFAPNRAFNYNLQLLRKKLNFFLDHDLPETAASFRSTKVSRVSDQGKTYEKVYYKWDHSGTFTLH